LASFLHVKRLTRLSLSGALFACCLLSANAATGEIALIPGGGYIVPISRAADFIHTCSRPAPAHVTGYWLPSEQDIHLFEATLQMPKNQRHLRSSHIPADSYKRQYVGILVKGRHRIYGNFFSGRMDGLEPTVPEVVCDGGPEFWGVEFDPVTKTLTELYGNGLA
jgi:hypothetical protein